MNKQLEWIILITDNYQKSKVFYQNILELEIVRDAPQEEFTQFKMNNCFLAIYGRKFVNNLMPQKYLKSSGGAIYTFAEVDNIDQIYQQLYRKGVKFISIPKTQSWKQRTTYFADPDGHIWEIQQWIK